MPEHYLVLGATGPSGAEFCKLALAEGNTITAYARTPSKLLPEISSHANFHLIKGDLTDSTQLATAASCGAKIFVSFAGPTGDSKGTPVTDGFKLLFPLLIENGVSRFLILGTPSFVVPGKDKGALKWKLSVAGIKMLNSSAYSEICGMGKLTTELPHDKVKWTFFRVPWLGNGEVQDVTEAFTGTGKDGFFLSRKSMATWVLRESLENKWVGEAPMLSTPSR